MQAVAAADKARVLVVDDESQITRVLRTVLTSQGYQVRTAAEGESALANFREWNPELVITEVAYLVATRLGVSAEVRFSGDLATGMPTHAIGDHQQQRIAAVGIRKAVLVDLALALAAVLEDRETHAASPKPPR